MRFAKCDAPDDQAGIAIREDEENWIKYQCKKYFNIG